MCARPRHPKTVKPPRRFHDHLFEPADKRHHYCVYFGDFIAGFPPHRLYLAKKLHDQTVQILRPAPITIDPQKPSFRENHANKLLWNFRLSFPLDGPDSNSSRFLSDKTSHIILAQIVKGIDPELCCWI